MKRGVTFLLIILLSSCNEFNLQKQSAEEILQEELKSINWKEVDFYPTFKGCGVITSKEESKNCFETEIKEAINHRLSQHQIITTNTAQDTIILELFISTAGKTELQSITMPDTISAQNPKLKNWLHAVVSDLPEFYPAQKRSVPVALKTKLPIILK
jgi:hypothetical protein